MQITGRTVVVTGAASGLGAATAARFVAGGARVVGLDLAASWEANPAPDGVRPVTADVTDGAQVADAFAQAATDGPVVAAVSCAGIAPSAKTFGRRGRHDAELFSSVVAVNLVGTFHVLTCAAEQMADNEPDADGQRGVVVATASIAAYDGQVGQIAYAASKGGVVSMTLPAARDLAPLGIRVVTLAPGVVDTPMMAGMPTHVREALDASVPNPSRMARPEEFAELVSFVVAHGYLNGETIRMDGALRMGAS